ncbi:integrase-type DNA-binding superfamily protein [Artemisia annua]|uniref:Integrase-type DNA-binding superfamily protein n=1 Tax=Artemisia annua TaxID=35608 RepID=A0A2U1PZ42_ARTAN|nr:integrase-type DNA-binding superfamily protein [Artemisia annua]
MSASGMKESDITKECLRMHNSQQSSSKIPQFYNSYLQNNPVLLHGLMNMGGSSSSVMDGTNNNGGTSSGSLAVEGIWVVLDSPINSNWLLNSGFIQENHEDVTVPPNLMEYPHLSFFVNAVVILDDVGVLLVG